LKNLQIKNLQEDSVPREPIKSENFTRFQNILINFIKRKYKKRQVRKNLKKTIAQKGDK